MNIPAPEGVMDQEEAYEDSQFWKAYAEFAIDARPRHLRAVKVLCGDSEYETIVDLGSGISQIARHLLDPSDYVPCDKRKHTPGTHVIDFSQLDDINCLVASTQADLVVSLFALDVILDPSDVRDIVRSVMETNSGVCGFLLAGFYYDDDRRLDPVVEETHGLVSYQASRGHFLWDFNETRIEMQAPSNLFGPRVIEVWRFIQR